MFSGAGVLGLFSDGARKSMAFVKLFRRGSQTEVFVVSSGTERWTGFDYGRHKNNVNKIFEILGR
jgi:hypothetical protein